MELRVYTLYRVSTIGQVEKDDIPMQRRSCREFAAIKGWTILEEFTEKGVSGFKKSAKERDAILQLQQAAMKGKFDILLVYMFDRLGRKDDETPFVVEWFVKQGIQVWSVVEGQQRFDTHVDKLMNYIRYWQASGESLKTSIRTKTRIAQLTEEGHFTGGVPAFGYRAVDKGRRNKKNKPVLDLEIYEPEAEVVRLIFEKYAYEGYGAQRLCGYLIEKNIMGRKGTNIPNTTIIRMIKNKLYAGILINGESEAECPELRIIDQELFDRAQSIRTERMSIHRDIPLNSKGKSLLVGRVYCGHCGNRLTLTTGGRRKHTVDGVDYYEARFRYQCHYNVRHPGECDGQSGYGVTKLDTIVDEVIRRKFAEIKRVPQVDLLEEQNGRAVEQLKSKIRQITLNCEKKQKEIGDYRAETIKVIRGESMLTADLLTGLIRDAEAELSALKSELEAAKNELEEREESTSLIKQEYDQIMTWADLYEHCSLEAKKMIVLQFIKAIHVHRDYQLDIEFNVSFEEFQKESMLNGVDFMTDAHKRGDYSELRSEEPWKPVPGSYQYPRKHKPIQQKKPDEA